MATLNRTFSVRNGLDVANTIVLDSNRNLTNIGNVNAISYVTSSGLNVTDQANNAYAAANAAANTVRVSANSGSTLSQKQLNFVNTGSVSVVVTDDGAGNANIAFAVTGAAAGDAYNQANAAYAQANLAYDEANTKVETVNTGTGLANSESTVANVKTVTISANVATTSVIGVTKLVDSISSNDTGNAATANAVSWVNTNKVDRAGDTMTGQLNISSGGLLVTGNIGVGLATATPTSTLHIVGNANITTNITTTNVTVREFTTSNTFVSSKTALQGPSTANFDGERVRLYDFNQAGHPNYAIGVEGSHIWMGVDDIGPTLGFKWYGNTTLVGLLRTNSTFEVSNTVQGKVLRATGTGTAVDASQGNILTNQVTGTAFNFLAGANTITVDASGATANYTFNLPANSGLVGQVLATDGTGDTYFTSTPFESANAAANTVRVSANGGSTLSQKQLNFVNSGSINVNVTDAGDGNANIVFSVTGAAAGDAYNQANAAYAAANLKVASINVSGNGLAVSNITTANNNDYTISVNTASTTERGTTLLIDSVSSSDTGNAATANAVKTAWDYANTKLSISGGTINGSLNVSGNLALTGNTTFINVSTYTVDDPLIYLGANNTLTDLVDIGFVATKNTSGNLNHTGLARDAGDATWYLFDNLSDSGHENNVIDFANTTYALLRANVYAQSFNVVTGYANVATTLIVGGNTTLKANLIAQQNVNVTGTLNVAGLTEFTNNVLVSAPLNVNSSLNVTGTSALTNTNVSGVLTITNSGEGLVVGNANVTYTLTVGSLGITTNTVTTSSSGQVVLDTFSISDYASAKYFVQANNSANYVVSEITLLHDGINVWLTEYGTIQSGPALGTFSADIDSGDIRLLFTANNNVNTIRSIRYGVLPP